MILKVERHYENEKWFLLAGIKSIDNYTPRKFHTEEERLSIFECDPEYVFIDNKRCKCYAPREECSECPSEEYYKNYRVAKLGLRMEDGSIETVLFDTVAYILNDSGKTIQKVVVNYPMYKDNGNKR
jgi:hypothetical protein